jgi:broad specificity phosphatase PhoE
MTIYLVRHGRAGDRSQWRHEDWLRPLSRAGRVQARGLLGLLRDARFERVLSSPYVRCLETVVPIAGARRLAIEPEDALGEGGDLDTVLRIVRKHMGTGALLCSHGDVIPAVLSSLAANGIDLGPDPRCPKGCTWVLEADGGVNVTSARYLPPPLDPDE